jgi:hypothetical protein
VQVRNPLSVVHSCDATKWNYEFKLSFAGVRHAIRVVDWVPAEYRHRFQNFPRSIRTLLWWTSFTILGEWQISKPYHVIRMEDIVGGNITALRRILQSVRGDAAARDINWTAISESIVNAPMKNIHAAHRTIAYASWRDIQTEVQKLSDLSDQRLSRRVICAAQSLCARLGYDFAVLCGSRLACTQIS